MSICFSCWCAVMQSGAGLASYSPSSFGKRINAMGFVSLLLREVECFGDEMSAMYDLGTSDF